MASKPFLLEYTVESPTLRDQYTVEPLKEDPPRKGHCIKYLSTMDETKSPNLSLPINIMRLEPLRRGQPL